MMKTAALSPSQWGGGVGSANQGREASVSLEDDLASPVTPQRETSGQVSEG